MLYSAGTVIEVQRELYNAGNEAIHRKALTLLHDSGDLEKAARFVVNERNLLKVQVRRWGPWISQKIAEARNTAKYGNPVGESYEQIFARKFAELADADAANLAIVHGVKKTSPLFNAVGPSIKVAASGLQVAISGILVNSPDSYAPLPKSEEAELEAEQARLAYGIPAGVNIDRHGHPKRNSYLQVDWADPHIASEISQETDEILWRAGADGTFHYGGATWVVPGYPATPRDRFSKDTPPVYLYPPVGNAHGRRLTPLDRRPFDLKRDVPALPPPTSWFSDRQKQENGRRSPEWLQRNQSTQLGMDAGRRAMESMQRSNSLRLMTDSGRRATESMQRSNSLRFMTDSGRRATASMGSNSLRFMTDSSRRATASMGSNSLRESLEASRRSTMSTNSGLAATHMRDAALSRQITESARRSSYSMTVGPIRYTNPGMGGAWRTIPNSTWQS
jgi:hypothetical protein